LHRPGGGAGVPGAPATKAKGGGLANMSIGGVSRKGLTTFTRQLSTLQDAGLPILRSLKILWQQQRPGLLKNTLDQIASAARLINGAATIPGGQIAPARPVTYAAPNTPVLPAPEPVPPVLRYHVVAEGESLTRISMRYYGTSTRWEEIYDANRDVLKGENALRPGQRLRIP